MTTIPDIVRHIEALAGHALNPDEGIQQGDSRRPVPGATVCWMATPEAIDFAHIRGHELLIVHENPGLRAFTGILRDAFPDVTYEFFENACVWRMA
ncbi:MAG: hypothetical protein WCI17_01885 [bacterium]